jgi:hypothetical protein
VFGRLSTIHFVRTVYLFMCDLRVHTEWQWPLSGIHSIMMEKMVQAGEGWGCTPTIEIYTLE